jgi:hypothetical protein
MLWAIFVASLVMWAFGVVSSHMMDGRVHMVLGAPSGSSWSASSRGTGTAWCELTRARHASRRRRHRHRDGDGAGTASRTKGVRGD